MPGVETTRLSRERGWTHWHHLFGARQLFLLANLSRLTRKYHEITEYFISWLRKRPPSPFDCWVWSSRRDLAIQGKDEEFRRRMVAVYAAMCRHMPDGGIQVVMLTHRDASVWADLGAMLAAGLQVCSVWNVVTETEKPSGGGNYVQGTISLVLRERLKEANARRMEIEPEIEEAVRDQLDRLLALNAAWRTEALHTDGDLTLAAYAACVADGHFVFHWAPKGKAT